MRFISTRIGSIAGALALLIQGLAMVPTQAASSGTMAWTKTDLTLSAYDGTVADVQMEFTYSGDIKNPNVKIVGGLAGSVSVDMTRLVPTSPGRALASIHVEMPTAPQSDYNANLQWTVDGKPQQQPLHLTVTPKTIDPNVIPEDIGFPSASRIGVSNGGTPTIVDQMVVYILPDDPAPAQTIKAIAASVSGQVVGAIAEMRRYKVRVPGATPSTIESLMDRAETLPGVESATLDVLGRTSAYTNDKVWQPSPSANADQNWNLQQIDAPAAWDLSTGKGVDVAVIDSGIDGGHADLAGNLKTNVTTTNSTIEHGTHTSGTACAQGDNGIGVVGVAWQCNLSMYGVYTNDKGAINTDDMWRRIETINDLPPADEAASSGPKAPRVVNVSLELSTPFDCTSPDLQKKHKSDMKALQVSRAKMSGLLSKRPDIMWVLAAGNNDMDSSCSAFGDLGNKDYLPNVVTVGASDRNGNTSTYSVRGGGVTLAAPGGEGNKAGTAVYSTYPQFCITAFGGQCVPVAYGYMAGTSMAAPHVTGTAALAFSANPKLGPADIKKCLIDGAAAGGKRITGQSYSIINAGKTVDCALGKATSTNAVRSITTNGSSAYALRADGKYWAWGENTSGQLGTGTSAAMNSQPAPVPNLTDVKSLVTGRATIFAVMKNGSVLAWGDNSHGLLGNNSTTNANTPQPVPGLTNVRSIVVNESDDPSMGFGDSPGLPGNTVFAVKNDGTVWAWGDNPSGVLGNGTTTQSVVPVQVLGLSGVATVASEGGTAWALKSDGSVESWGDNADGQLGIGAAGSAPSLTPQPVEISDVTSIQAGYHALVALKNDGTVWAWGIAGNGLVHGTTNQPAPQQKASLSSITKISVQRFTGVAIKNDGTAWGWGSNANGEAGIGLAGTYVGGTWANNNISTPLQMPNLSNVTDIQVGMALTADGTAWWWSQGGSGPGGYPHPESPVQVLSGAAEIRRVLSTRWALKSDGTLWGWGNAYNLFGGGGYLPRQIIG